MDNAAPTARCRIAFQSPRMTVRERALEERATFPGWIDASVGGPDAKAQASGPPGHVKPLAETRQHHQRLEMIAPIAQRVELERVTNETGRRGLISR